MSQTPTLRMLLPVLLIATILAIVLGRTATQPPIERDHEMVKEVVSREVFEGMSPLHRRMIARIVEQNVAAGRPVAAACWEVNAGNQAQVEAFNAAIAYGGPNVPEFQQAGRWTSGALVSGATGQGDPVTLTYSFVPDGTTVPSGVGEPSAASDLFAWMNGIYGSPAVWQQYFHDEFQRWGDHTGITFIHETSDDGAAMFGAGGVVGTRGDIRIAAKFIDGNSNVLAYNYYPNTGDMVIDSADNYYNTTSNDSRRLRNVLGHEMGHGLGMAHVCPISMSKLMEPFALTNILGPQEDDILNGQRHYGDDNEPNDAAVAATDLGSLTSGLLTVAGVSIDDSGDSDWFSFTTSSSRTIDLTLRPTGSLYNEGPQTSPCGAGTPYDALSQLDLAIDLIDTDGASILAAADANGVGLNEQIANVDLIVPGTYYLRVRHPGSGNAIQSYELDIDLQPYASPYFDIAIPEGPPTELVPDFGTPVRVVTTSTGGAPDPAQARLWTSINGGAFVSTPLVDLGQGVFRADLPAVPCFANLDWYVEMPVLGGASLPERYPAHDAADLLLHSSATATQVTDVFVDDFQADLGWASLSHGSVTGGSWERAVPTGGDPGAPSADADGSGFCYVTGNGAGNDLDGGPARLISPTIDLSPLADPFVRFSIWLSNDQGPNPNEDDLEIFMSDDDGSNWVLVETYSGNDGAWVRRGYRIADHVAINSTFKMRFRVSDPSGSDSTVEAGLDDFRISTCDRSADLSPWAAGSVGILNGAPVDIFTIDGSAGGPARTVTVPVGQSYASLLGDPPGFGGAGYAMFARIGRPGPIEVIQVSPQAGSLCFVPSPLDPLNGSLATVAWTYPGGVPGNPPLTSGTPTPWAAVSPGIPFPIEVAIQAVISEGPALRVTNMVVLKIQ